MRNKVISFIEAPTFRKYNSSLFPKSRYRDFKLIQFQIGVLSQGLREDVRELEQLFKNYFVSSNMRELYGDRISRLTDRINSGDKFANGEDPRAIYDDLRKTAVEVRSMQHEVLSSIFQEFATQEVFKIHEGEASISELNSENNVYLDTLFSSEVSTTTMATLISGVDASARLNEEQLSSILSSLKAHGLIDKDSSKFTEKFKQEMIDDDPTLFEDEKIGQFQKWLGFRDYPTTSIKTLISGLKQQYLLTHLEVIKSNLVNRAIDADIGLAVNHHGFCSFIPIHVAMNRVINLPSKEGVHKNDFIYVEDLIRSRLKVVMGFEAKYAETRVALFVRNVNVPFTIKDSPDERKVIARGVLDRKTAPIVMIEVEEGASPILQGFLKRQFKFSAGYYKHFPVLKGVMPIEVAGRVDARFVADIYKAVDRKDLKYEEYKRITPKYNSYVRYAMFKELLFQWPYHEFIIDKVVNETIDIYEYLKKPEVLGADKVKLSVYQSLYRTSEDSGPMKALERAAKAGAYTVIICEIKARLDEIANFKWARRLKEAGAHVFYSMMKRKIHTKVTVSKLEIKQEGLLSKSDFSPEQWEKMIKLGLIETVNAGTDEAVCTKLLDTKLLPEGFRPPKEMKSMLPAEIVANLALSDEQNAKLCSSDICLKITHVGTGNIRESSAKAFEDINIFSSIPSLGRECIHMFNSLLARMLPNEPEGEMWFGNHLKEHLREKIMGEIAKGNDGYICLKVNQLEDDEMIDLLYQASQAGVKVDLFVRGFNIIRTANLEPLSLTNANIGAKGLVSDTSRIISNEQAISIWGRLTDIGIIDENNLVSCDYLAKRNQLFSLLCSELGRDKAEQIMDKVLDEAFRMREFSENIRLYRVIDRHLEHSRIYIFGKGEDADVILGSADIMKRNLRKRQEANRVIKDKGTKKEIQEIIDIYKNKPAHMEAMTANERYYLMDVDQTGKTAQEQLEIRHHINRDDGYANLWMLDYFLGTDNSVNVLNELKSQLPVESFIGDDISISDETIEVLKHSRYSGQPGFNEMLDSLIKIRLQRWE